MLGAHGRMHAWRHYGGSSSSGPAAWIGRIADVPRVLGLSASHGFKHSMPTVHTYIVAVLGCCACLKNTAERFPSKTCLPQLSSVPAAAAAACTTADLPSSSQCVQASYSAAAHTLMYSSMTA